MSNLENGMVFENVFKLCDYLELTYSESHIDRAYNKVNKFCKYSKINKSNIIIDEVFENVKYADRSRDYFYNNGDIINTRTGKIEIINRFRLRKSNTKHYTCKCIKCNHEYPEYEYNLKKGVGCAVCANKKVKIGINDMWTTAPEMAELLSNPEDGYKYTMKSHKKVDWKCPQCEELIKDKAINNVFAQGVSCPACGRFKSYPNRLMYNLLKYLGLNFENERTFSWSNNKIYDFYLTDYDTIIEMHGKQHYERFIFTEGYEEIHNNDIYKENIANNNNVTNYIVIDSRFSNLKWISDNIIKSDLTNYINFNNVDWNKIELLTITSVVKTACKLWNDKYDIDYISKEIGYCNEITTRMLRKCEKNGLTNERNKFQNLRVNKMRNTCYQRSGKPFMCIETSQYFGSVNILENLSNELFNEHIIQSNIMAHLKGKSSHAKNFHFTYITREEFNNRKQKFPEYCFGEFFIIQNEEKQSL